MFILAEMEFSTREVQEETERLRGNCEFSDNCEFDARFIILFSVAPGILLHGRSRQAEMMKTPDPLRCQHTRCITALQSCL